MKNRDFAIDLIKFIGVLLIINSHLGVAYPKWSFLASGGAIGNSLFFFASGFLLSHRNDPTIKSILNGWGGFFKTKISRIYSSLFAVIIFKGFMGDDSISFHSVIFYVGGYWFVKCILLYFIFSWPLINLKNNSMLMVCAFTSLFCLLLCCFLEHEADLIFGNGGFWIKVPLYWPVLCTGIILGRFKDSIIIKPVYGCAIAFVSIALFYLSCWLTMNNTYDSVAVLPLIIACVGLYIMFHSQFVKKIMEYSFIRNLVLVICAVSLESYMIQFSIITDKLNNLFPLNILILITTIIVVSIIIRVFSKLILQTFSKDNYNVKELINITK